MIRVIYIAHSILNYLLKSVYFAMESADVDNNLLSAFLTSEYMSQKSGLLICYPNNFHFNQI